MKGLGYDHHNHMTTTVSFEPESPHNSQSDLPAQALGVPLMFYQVSF